ncbi:MAG TPA: aspartate kinase [Terriglobales bacterium]|nr:aspartate kinase [Terriglobales bacterium]
MSLITMKFGGTSVGDAERLRDVGAIVRQAAQRDKVVVVVSAMAGVTDLIVRALQAATAGSQSTVVEVLRGVQRRHQAVLDELFPADSRDAIREQVDAVLEQLHEFCHALSLLRSSTPQVLDVALPMGEKMSAQILAAYLGQDGTKAAYVDAVHVLVTDDKFGDASPDMEGTRRRCRETLLPLLDQGVVPVITGYCGATAKGQPTTLGRGGSDYSATILGTAIASGEIWIWTDVNGVLTADPRVCPEAGTLPEITYAEAIELSYYGAKVIHRRAVWPAMQAGIPVWIKNSFAPQAAGTRIAATVAPIGSPVKAVTAVTQASLLTLTTRRDVHFAEIFGRLFLRLAHEHVDVLFSTQSSSENALGLVFRERDTEHVLAVIHRLFRNELKHGILNQVEVQRNIAVIAVLGETMKGTFGILARLFAAVARRNVSVIAMTQGASELNICFAVPAVSANEVVHAVHQEFLGAASPARASVAERTPA